MKFVDEATNLVYYYLTSDHVEYRTTEFGQIWERLWNDGWELVVGQEEEDCKKAWDAYRLKTLPPPANTGITNQYFSGF